MADVMTAADVHNVYSDARAASHDSDRHLAGLLALASEAARRATVTERARVVAWLRKISAPGSAFAEAADVIECGDTGDGDNIERDDHDTEGGE